MGKLWKSLLNAGPIISSTALVLICFSVLMHEADSDMHHCNDRDHNINVEQETGE